MATDENKKELCSNFIKGNDIPRVPFHVCKSFRSSNVLNIVFQVLKLYAWEPSFQKKILELRRLEVAELKKAAILSSVNVLCWITSPVLVMFIFIPVL